MKQRLFALLIALVCLLTACTVTPENTTGTGTQTPTTTESAEPVSTTLKVYCFQAGKADAFLLWNEDGAVLIDTGESGFGKEILDKMTELGVRRLDYLIITHFDKDHVGGAKKLISSIPIDNILQSNAPKEGSTAYEKYLKALEEQGKEAVTVRETLRFTLGEVQYTVNPPARESYQTDESNNASLIVSVTHGPNRLLFTGDAEDERMNEFLDTNPGTYSFLKVPHHGVYQSSLIRLLEVTRPAYALITSSDEEPEDEKTLDLLTAQGTETFLTRTGPVLLQSDNDGLRVAYDQ